jgi:predicted secreted hydrolase
MPGGSLPQLRVREFMATHRRVRLCAIVTAVAAGLLTPMLVAIAPASAAQPAISLPADEGPHPSSSMEWWYFTGHLTGTDPFGHQHQYGFELNFIRTNSLGLEPLAATYDGQFAITDLTRGTFTSNLLAISEQPDNVLPQGGYNITIDGWNMQGSNGQNHVSAAFPDASYGMDLTLSQSTPPALHGNGGLVPYAPFGTSYYYSETNLHASGLILDHGVPVTVTGIAWQDHQWGNFNGTGGWTWFSMQLGNGTQYMLYFLHDGSGNLVEKLGTLVNADGSTVNIDPSQMSQVPLGSWTNPATGNTYPQNWLVTVPGGQLTVTVDEANQELSVPLLNSGYYEGDSAVSGTIGGRPVTGQAYAEVTPSFTAPLGL